MTPVDITAEERELLLGEWVEKNTTDPLPASGNDQLNNTTSPRRATRRWHQQQHLDAIRSYHAEVDDRFADALSRGLEQLVEVTLREASSSSYSQFAFSRSTPTCLVLVHAEPLPTPLAFDLSPTFLYPVLDCLLGGGRQPCSPPNRPPTELEQRLSRRVVDWLLVELHRLWEPLLAVQLSVERTETNAQRVRMVAPSERVTVLSFHARVANQRGEFALCLPDRGLRRMVDKLLAGEYLDTPAGRDGADPTEESPA